MSAVILKIDDREYHGWKSVQITRSMQTISGYFQLGYTDRWHGQKEPLPIFPGQTCSVFIDQTPLITGHIDAINPSFDKDSRSASFSGRDRTADLVDCSTLHKPDEFRGVTLDYIVRALVAPFQIKVKVETKVGAPFDVFKLQPGETVFEAIERAARLRGILLLSDGLGNVVLAKPNAQPAIACLVQGENVLGADAQCDVKECYSRYMVKGQQQGFDSVLPELTSQVRAEASDATITRYRPLLILSEAQVNNANAQTRANWEAAVRAARSEVITVTVQGWTHNEEQLWTINQRVAVKLPWLGIDSELLISQVTYALNEGQGSTTTLQLMRPDAFIPQPQIPPSATTENWKKLIDADNHA